LRGTIGSAAWNFESTSTGSGGPTVFLADVSSGLLWGRLMLLRVRDFEWKADRLKPVLLESDGQSGLFGEKIINISTIREGNSNGLRD
jgi:hypothetical protein